MRSLLIPSALWLSLLAFSAVNFGAIGVFGWLAGATVALTIVGRVKLAAILLLFAAALAFFAFALFDGGLL